MATLTLSDEQLQTIAQALTAEMGTIAAHAGRCLADGRKAEAMGDGGEYESWFDGPQVDPVEVARAKYLALGVILDEVKTAAGLLAWGEEAYRGEFMAEAERTAASVGR